MELWINESGSYIKYCYYSNQIHNDLLYLFNLCRNRKNEYLIEMLNEYVSRITSDIINNNPIAQFETIFVEIEHYGN